MKVLHRPIAPTCLALKDYNIHEFSSLSQGQKRAIWRSLTEMQNTFCAYCEKKIIKNHRQIEHFYPKGDTPDGVHSYKQLTFEWENLFGGCTESEHCGQHKDREGELTPKPYSPDNLIKPDTTDASDILSFTESGEVIVLGDLEESKAFKGRETIRVFNLNNPALVDSRKEIIASFNIRLKGILELAEEIPDNEFADHMDELTRDISQSEHHTAIKAVLLCQ
ncbi:retron Ec78 anti-phage system effector HNH endonuclease PtuB [Aliivibrio fischeri]|uniref:retron Ec78 anti-phage system effector HNH endonuclease PtuB n=1 Tax=Aliivibrio fischeri TaxID=668 RepID=UPI0012DAA36D|nr:retron Ec78 anti-phage system effector HNH endonuclease PtuB [Aliivibrio fischeri]MUJ36027.1 TIGR02646 family protein [Aliivibrio fischeri]